MGVWLDNRSRSDSSLTELQHLELASVLSEFPRYSAYQEELEWGRRFQEVASVAEANQELPKAYCNKTQQHNPVGQWLWRQCLPGAALNMKQQAKIKDLLERFPSKLEAKWLCWSNPQLAFFKLEQT